MNKLIKALGAACMLLALPAVEAADKKALVGGTLIDGLGGTPIQDNVILVDGERIEKVGTVGTLPVPDGYDIISTEAMTVLP
ncbi:MAG: Xaa-Pro dipeptidase, partial [Kordiimonas sp.]